MVLTCSHGGFRGDVPGAAHAAVAGDPDECAEKIRRLLDAGSDAVALFPLAGDPESAVRTVAAEVLPRC